MKFRWTAISRMIEEALQMVPGFAEAFEQIGEQPSGASCAKLARSGNETAAGIFEKAGRYLGRGIAAQHWPVLHQDDLGAVPCGSKRGKGTGKAAANYAKVTI